MYVFHFHLPLRKLMKIFPPIGCIMWLIVIWFHHIHSLLVYSLDFRAFCTSTSTSRILVAFSYVHTRVNQYLPLMHIVYTYALKKKPFYAHTSSYVVWRVDPQAMGQDHIMFLIFLLHLQMLLYQFDPLESPSIAHPDLDMVGSPPRLTINPQFWRLCWLRRVLVIRQLWYRVDGNMGQENGTQVQVFHHPLALCLLLRLCQLDPSENPWITPLDHIVGSPLKAYNKPTIAKTMIVMYVKCRYWRQLWHRVDDNMRQVKGTNVKFSIMLQHFARKMDFAGLILQHLLQLSIWTIS